MAVAAKPIVPVQVRELVEFALRRGDLGGETDFVGPSRALAGIRGHQRIQRSRPAEYQKEVRLAYELDGGEFVLRVQGRIDGLLVTGDEVLLEEIKTVRGGWDGAANPLHWAQAKCYSYIYAREQALEKITILLTYLDLETGKATGFREHFSFAELAAFFEETTAIYLEWVREQRQWGLLRDQSIQTLAFPFTQYRPGQRKLAVAAYRVLAQGGRLFLEAPTGIGKTISVLFPAVKAMGESKLERIFYLTARTVGRAVAEKAFADLRQGGLRLRTLTLTAKEKICPQSGQACDPAGCPFARGYYDRHKGAMRAALAYEEITRPVLEKVSQEHQVCPFELSLDLSSWVDAVICDYNYVFDPKVYLRRHFGEEPGDYAFLIDEAHNLVDRAREMFSAELDRQEIREVRRVIKKEVPRCARALSRLSSALGRCCEPAARVAEPAEDDACEDPELDLFSSGANSPAEAEGGAAAEEGSAVLAKAIGRGPAMDRSGNVSSPSRSWSLSEDHHSLVSEELPADLLPQVETALKEAETWLARNEPAEFREALLELYFRLYSFQRIAAGYDEHYVTIGEPGTKARVRLFCLDPSAQVRQALARGKAALFFSATLTPLDYYRDLLGGEPGDPVLQLASPFPPENLAVLVQDRIRTQFKARAETLVDVAQAIRAVTEQRRGNYLVYFPSYQYLAAVQAEYEALHPTARLLAQRPGMDEAEREAFLASFTVEHGETLVGFAVMGGIFGEGIDLVGERLIGAIIVGVGLPQLCLERDLIRDYFQEKTGAGFDYAYTFPGMNRVLQAIGRVIRSETDRGVVLLIDTRFAEARYRRLFPAWWHAVVVRYPGRIGEAVREFWGGSCCAREKPD